MVARGKRPLRHGSSRGGGEDEPCNEAPTVRLLLHMGPYTREAPRPQPNMDLRNGDEALHVQVRCKEGGYSAGEREE
ncbi:hypothetical protein D1872_309500 [compost metagenome]